MLMPQSFAAGQWISPGKDAREFRSPIDGDILGRAGSALPPIEDLIHFATSKGGPALRELGFHDRARMLKAVAQHLDARKEELYALNPLTGATRKDGWIDIDGGIGTLFVYASKGRREMPDGKVYLDGAVERISRNGTFLGQHIALPKPGVAIHINAFNFPVWGMLEKLAPAWLAGVPAIVKPATQTAFLAEACARLILESGLLPDGALQLIVGTPKDLLARLGPQDVVAFTGSAITAHNLRTSREFLASGAKFIAEQDSLNAAILGPDASPGSPEFDLFIREATAEITTKAGQKCTAMRRLIVPDTLRAAVEEALATALSSITPGDPRDPDTRMGTLVSPDQQGAVRDALKRLSHETRTILAPAAPAGTGRFAPGLLSCNDPDGARAVHEVEAFGPVATILPYRDTGHAAQIANRSGGSLVTSLFTRDSAVAARIVSDTAPWNGRIYINNRDSADEATGHGSPLPHMTHGGPGRAGGGEELGGIRAVMHYMQRTAVQASPNMLASLGGQWVQGADETNPPAHPFRLGFDMIEIGHTLWTAARRVTLQDIEHFAEFTGDSFYAHMDDAAARANPFFPGRVAHGYLLLSFAAGLFVDPAPGPVLANTGLNGLAFQKPVGPGDEIRVRLTAKRKTRRNEEYGEVAWNVTLFNQDDDQVAEYELLTMVAYTP